MILCASSTEVLLKYSKNCLKLREYQEISWNKMYDEKSLKIENQINKLAIKQGVKLLFIIHLLF